MSFGFFLRQEIAFCGYDESKESSNRGNFLELLQFLANHNEQCDETRDISIKEQMAIVFRYVDKRGHMIEQFVCVMHIPKTSVILFKAFLEEFFCKHNLSVTRLRGQGYDRTSNMRGEQVYFFVHCSVHQLQLAFVHVAKDIPEIALFFSSVGTIVNTTGALCKYRDKLRKKEVIEVFKVLESGELLSGRGLNQETSMKQFVETRWGSHYATLVNLIIVFPSVVGILDDVMEDGSSSDQRGEFLSLLDLMQSFNIVFTLLLMRKLVVITNDLSKVLQKENEDIVNVMTLKIHYYQYYLFNSCIDKQLAKLNNRFDEVNTEFLLCMACLNSTESFGVFNVEKLVRLAEFYPDDFSEQERMDLHNQLKIYEIDKYITYHLIYKLIKLSLILPVVTATVERDFSAMNIIKNRLQNQMGDEWLNDCLVTYIEKDVFDTICDGDVI
ncbi:hypothetical protein AQUCO_06900034v1 [Aquilegia coerulea]|uniref:DUF4371 domain-containing protein n=1 Tax=Aquilegia coerulea TaxID=218851 RepID=A0A2G5CB41_AQUCA|nr:hypothetical protein AQUCO_06900034v1 [Aquilegia coerulea]